MYGLRLNVLFLCLAAFAVRSENITTTELTLTSESTDSVTGSASTLASMEESTTATVSVAAITSVELTSGATNESATAAATSGVSPTDSISSTAEVASSTTAMDTPIGSTNNATTNDITADATTTEQSTAVAEIPTAVAVNASESSSTMAEPSTTTNSEPTVAVAVNKSESSSTMAELSTTTNSEPTVAVAVNESESSSTMAELSTTTNPSATTTTTTESVTTAASLPATTVPAAAKPICGHDVEDIQNVSACHDHKTVILNSDECDADQLPPGEWIRFAAEDNSCRQIPMFYGSTCFTPGSCGSNFPYYLSGTALPSAGSSSVAKLCTTDTGSTKNAYCCKEAIDIEMLKCADKFFVYKLSTPMTATACGKVCLSSTADKPPFSFVVNNSDSLQQKYEDLEDEAKSNLVAILLHINNMTRFENKWIQVTNSLTTKVKEALEKTLNKRRKRSAASKEIQVDVLDGYPVVDIDKHIATYVLYTHYADGTPIEKKHVENALADLEGEDPLVNDSGSTIGKTTSLPKELQPVSSPRVDTSEPVPPKGTKLWTAIIIIICVTAFIVAIAFIAVWCYNFSRRGRSGSMHVSHKEGLVQEDELNNSYTPTGGHVNVAMEDDGLVVDSNRNANGKSAKDKNTIEMQQVEENAV